MGIYIKSMEMPKNCGDCWFEHAYEFCESKYEDCPLIELPPHGRLIDADELTKMCQEMQSNEWNNKAAPYSWAYAYESFESDVDNAPTIIGAEPCNDLAKPNKAEEGE